MKTHWKGYLVMIFLFAAGGMIYLYAEQRDFAGTNVANEDPQAEDIGALTDDDPWQEMDKLVQAYYKKEGTSYKGSLRLIDDNGEKEKVIEQQAFEYSIAGRSMYYRVGGMEVISKIDLSLVADNTNKTIFLSLQKANDKNNKRFFDIKEFKKLMQTANAKAKVTQIGSQKILTIESIDDPQIQGYRIYYDSETYQVSKMLIGMVRFTPLDNDNSAIGEMDQSSSSSANNPEDTVSSFGTENADIDAYTYFLEIIYEEVKSLDITENLFRPENKFIIKTGNKFQLIQPFADYQLITNGAIRNDSQENNEEQN